MQDSLDIGFANIISHSVSCLFTFLKIFDTQTSLISQFIYLFIFAHTFDVISISHCQSQGNGIYPYAFFHLIVLVLIFVSLIHFELNFWYTV